MLQKENPSDYVIATGVQYTVKEFIEECARRLEMKISWEGEGINEIAKDEDGKKIISISEKYFRPTEVETLLGDAAKARKELNWTPKITFSELVDEMVGSEENLLI